MTNHQLAFIGAGNIARAIIGGLINSGYRPDQISAADPAKAQLELLPPGVTPAGDNRTCAADADVIVLCVKPDKVVPAAREIAPIAAGKLIITVAAGIPVAALLSALGDDAPVIRCMPNTPALVGLGMTGLYANPNVSAAQREAGEQVLSAIGRTQWFDDEDDLDRVTAVSGSGPAYFFLVMEAMEQAAVSLGLPREASRALVLQTAVGAAQMALSSEDAPEVLRQKVTSPGGTTEAAIKTLLAAGLPEDFRNAIEAAWKRSRELAATQAS